MSTEACLRVVKHEGRFQGKNSRIGGIESYIAIPPGTYDKSKAIVLCTDIFCLKLNNNLLLADSFAENGFYTVVPDIYEGDAVDPEAHANGQWDRQAWFRHHPPEAILRIEEKVISALEADGFRKIAAGAREAVQLAIQKRIQAVALAHPSKLDIPEVFGGLATAETPVLFNTAESDQAASPETLCDVSCLRDVQFDEMACKHADEILGGKEFYKRTFAPGCSHGFAVRGDLSNPQIREGKEKAFEAQLAWFHRWL